MKTSHSFPFGSWPLLTLCLILASLTVVIRATPVLADSGTSFYPTWKLLTPKERKLFVSGYVKGWRDAKTVTDILLTHVAKEPKKAVSSLEKVREIYGVADIPVEQLLDGITKFYSDPVNHDSALSVAISSSR